MDEAQRVENKNSNATPAPELAHLRAEAATAQAKADKELFEQTQALRAEYAGQSGAQRRASDTETRSPTRAQYLGSCRF